MKRAPIPSFRALCFSVALAPGFPSSAVFAATSPSVTAATADDVHNKEQAAALKGLDAAIARFEALINRVTSAQHKATSQGFLDAFRERRSTLLRAFDQAAYNDLRLDLHFESQRMAAWLMTATMNVPAGNAERAADIFFLLGPAPADQPAVKAAFEALDREIKRLDQHATATPAGTARDAENRRVDVIKQRRAELGQDFTPARWDALIEELKKQWGQQRR